MQPIQSISENKAPGWEGKVLIVLLVLVFGMILSLAFGFLKLPVAAGAIGAVCFMVLAVQRPVLGLALLCSILTIEGISGTRLEITEVRVAGIAAFGAWIGHLLLYGKRLRINSAFKAALLFFLWAGFSLLWAREPFAAAPHYATLAQLLLLFLLTVNVVEQESDFHLVLAGLLLGAVVTSQLSIHLFIANFLERARTFEAQNANNYAAVVGLALIGGMYLAGRLKNWPLKAGCGLLSCGLAIPLILAQSRTAWVAVLSAIGVFLWHTKHRVRNLLLVLVSISGVVAAVFAFGLINFTVIERTSQLVNMGDRGSNRFDIWSVGAKIVEDHPITGVGFMQFPVAYNRYRAVTPAIRQDQTSGRDPHSVYLGVAAEMGLIGLALLLLIFWRTWREVDLPKAAAPWISDALLVYTLVFSLGGTVYRNKFFWLALALSVKARQFAAERLAEKEGGG